MRTQDMQAVFSTGKDDWGTPKLLFQKLHDEFNFCVDVCATNENKLIADHIGPGGKIEDAINGACWGDACNRTHAAGRYFNHTFFMNPPYSNVADFMQRMAKEAGSHKDRLYVALVAARTDTKWFHEYVLPKASEIRFIKGRVTFAGAPSTAPFPSMVVVYNTVISGEHWQDTSSWSYRD